MTVPQTPKTAVPASVSVVGEGEPLIGLLKLRLSTKPKLGPAANAAAREGAVEPTPESRVKATRRATTTSPPASKVMHKRELAGVNKEAAERYRGMVHGVPENVGAKRYDRALVACGYLLAARDLAGHTVRVGLYLAFQICLKRANAGLHKQMQRDLGLTSSQVSLAIGKLEEVGLIAKSKVSKKKGDGRERRYRFKHEPQR